MCTWMAEYQKIVGAIISGEKEEWSAERSQMQQKLVMADMQVAEAKQRALPPLEL
mgnify:CR=1 FL=1